MSLTSFDELLDVVRPQLTKNQTNMRNPIGAEQRLTQCQRDGGEGASRAFARASRLNTCTFYK